jgi:hypothetical protein
MLRCISENNLRFFAQICTDYQLMYLCSAFGDAPQTNKQERSYEIQIGNSSIEGILRQQRPSFSEGRGEDETTDG